MKTIDFLGYSVYAGERILESLADKEKKTIVNTINPHSYCEAGKDSFYQQALVDSDFLLPDGVGIIMAIWILTRSRVKLFTGSDLHILLLKKMNKTSGKVFYMGSTHDTLQKIRNRIKREYPNVLVETYSPPFKPVFTDKTNALIMSAINDFKPDVLFIGMTAPKQEKWVRQHKNMIDANLIASVGAVFDFYAGTIQRPGKFWLWLHLEWLVRLIGEPKRLWRRSFVSTPLFLKDILLTKIGLLKHAKKKTTLEFKQSEIMKSMSRLTAEEEQISISNDQLAMNKEQ